MAAFNRHSKSFVNATEAPFSMSAISTNEFRHQEAVYGKPASERHEHGDQREPSPPEIGSGYAKGTFRTVDFAAGISNTTATDNGASARGRVFSISNA